MKKRKLTALLLSAVIMCSACADNNAEITTTVTENVITEEITESSETNPEYEVVDGTVIFSEDITVIPYGVLFGDTEYTKIIIPDGVEVIEEIAFSGCNNVTEIHLPDSIRIIGQGAFPNGEKLNIIYKGKTYSYKDKALFYNTFRELDYIAPPDGMTTDDLCGILYYNGKQLQLPLTAEDFLALNENWVFDGIEGADFAGAIREVDENGSINFGKSMHIFACDDGSVHSHEDVNRRFIMGGFDLDGFSLNNDIEIGDDYSEFKEFFGEPSLESHYSEEEKNINGCDYYFFRDEKRVFSLGVEYADGKFVDIIDLRIEGLLQD
ncbi:MAG: leucine-rich repeat protein [Ruminiclostridium sp.]|nr:leucine-rich repeat protein [Ruminiclostridium sp.]